MKIKWNFFRPYEGVDEEGDYYHRADHWGGVAWAYVKIILVIIVSVIIGSLLNI